MSKLTDYDLERIRNEINDEEDDPPKSDVPEQQVFEHLYHLREDFTVRLILPQDLTHDEAERLRTFIKSLPLW
jgi:hypothetical protein